VDYTESSRIITLICPHRGRLACLAAGARRPKSPLRPILDLYNRVEIVYFWKESREVQRLAEVSLLNGYSAIKSDLLKSVYTAFPVEIVYRVVQKDEPSEHLYRVLADGLDSMEAWTGHPANHAAWQVAQLMTAAGFSPVLEPYGETACSCSFTGEVATRFGTERGPYAEVFEELIRLVLSREQCPVVKYPQEVFDVLRQFVIKYVETDFRSLRVLDQIARKNEFKYDDAE